MGSRVEGAAPRNAGKTIKVEVISNEDDLLAIRQDWDRLFESCHEPSVFTSFDWVWAWWRNLGSDKAFGGQRKLHILVAQQDAKIDALAPLMVSSISRPSFSTRKIEFLGSLFSDSHDWLLSGDSLNLTTAMLEHLADDKESWDLIELRNIPSTSKTMALLRQGLERAGLSHRVRLDAKCMSIPIKADWHDFLKDKSRRFRRTFRHMANRLGQLKADGLQVRIVENPRDEPGLLRRMVILEMRKRVRGAPSLHVLPVAERFFEFILDKWGPSGGIYAAVMEKSGELIAYELGFRHGKALLAFNKAYEPSYAHYSPGTMLIPSILDFGYKRGYQEYNLGRGDQAYKHMWTENFRQNLRIEIWNNRLCSRVAALLDFGIRPIYCHFLSKLGIRYVPDWDL